MVAALSNSMRVSIRGIHKSIIKRETTISNICNESLRLIDETAHLNPFITICKDKVLDQASKLDKGTPTNPLYGIPISIKDNFCTDQVLTTCGSKMLYNFIPPYNATPVSKLINANCIITGKTNMDEFAMGSSCTTSYFGPTANCWNSNNNRSTKTGEQKDASKPSLSNSADWYIAGGSSTGSAVSVASGACFASLGTDTGGSTRQPASLTGVVGFKPTYGLISRFGLIPLAHCLDVVSILARNVDDVQLVFEVVVGQDDNDLTTVDHEIFLEKDKSIDKIRIGIPEDFINKGNPSDQVMQNFNSVVSNLRGNLNCEVINLQLPQSSLATECYTIISSAEIASNMSCYDGIKYGFASKIDSSVKFDRNEFYRANRDQGLGIEVKKRILLGNYFLLAHNRERYLTQAMRLRRLISDEFNRAFIENKVDVILTPATPTTSVTYKEWLQKQDDNKLFREDYFLIPSNLANLPSISVPSGLSGGGFPVGLQLIANKFQDLTLLAISKLFENSVLKNMLQ